METRVKGRAPRAQRGREGWVVLGLMSLVLAGCTAILETDRKQCKSDMDCGELNGVALYSCERDFCTAVACTTDAECQALGGQVCEAQSCAPPLCTSDMECTTSGDSCVAGRCKNAQFHCFSEQPPLMVPEEPVLQFILRGYVDQKPVTNLEIQVCSTLDVACNSPIEAILEYDGTTGLTKLRGLENGRLYSLRFRATDSMGFPLQETDYVMQRPVVGLTEEAVPFELVPEGLITVLADSADTPYDPTKGTVLAQIFGCDDTPVAGVTATSNRAGTLFYLTSNVDANATATDGSGQVGFVNMETSESGAPRVSTLTFSRGGVPFYSFSVAPRPGILTYLYMYMPDYGTTTNRAQAVMP